MAAAHGRYAPLRATLGDELFEKVHSSKILLIGAGGIGCELIKNLVLTGFVDIEVIDLDTIGPSTLAVELGDAWRSWCNPAGEDNPDAVCFSIEAFSASAAGWLEGWSSVGVPISADEKQSLVPGIERICLELSARFCTDSLKNSYFKEDLQRHPVVGTHNLIRAKSQLRLAREAKSNAESCQRILNN